MKDQVLNGYDQQAVDFLYKTNTTIEMKFLKNDFHFEGDKEKRDIYLITIKRGNRQFSFNFGQSIVNSQHYVDTLNKRKYSVLGIGIGNNYKITPEGLRDFCNLVKGTEPRNYDILACLTKYDPGTFENFCSEFGYDEDSRMAEKTYKAICEEYKNLCALFNEDEMDLLREIN